MLEALKTMSDEDKLQVIAPYYKALKNSKFKENSNLFDRIKSVLTNDQWQEISKDEDESLEGEEK